MAAMAGGCAGNGCAACDGRGRPGDAAFRGVLHQPDDEPDDAGRHGERRNAEDDGDPHGEGLAEARVAAVVVERDQEAEAARRGERRAGARDDAALRPRTIATEIAEPTHLKPLPEPAVCGETSGAYPAAARPARARRPTGWRRVRGRGRPPASGSRAPGGGRSSRRRSRGRDRRLPGCAGARAATSTARARRKSASYTCVGWRRTPSPKSTPQGSDVATPNVWSSSPVRKQPIRPMAIATASGTANRSPVRESMRRRRFAPSTASQPPAIPPTIVLPASR